MRQWQRLLAVGWCAVLFGALQAAAGAAAPAAPAATPPTAPPTRFGSHSLPPEPRLHTVGAAAIPRGVVPALAQDRAGFLWVATGDGVVRYDGHRFMPQERASADPARRNLGWMRAMLATRDGRVWMGSEVDGLVAHDPATDTLIDAKDPALGAAPSPTITALAEDADGGIWAGTVGAGLQHYHPQTRQHRRYRQSKEPGSLPDDRVRALLVARDGTLWVGHDGGLARRVPNGARFDAWPATGTGTVSGVVQALAQASDGRVWIGTQQGRLFIVEPTDGSVKAVPAPADAATRASSAAAGAVTSLAEDGSGVMWVGRSTGIDLHDVASGRALRALRHDLARPQGLAGHEVVVLLRDRDGAMWVGGFGIGLQRHDPERDAIHVHMPLPAAAGRAASADLRSLLQHSDGSLWAADHAGRLLQMDGRLALSTVLPPYVVDGEPLRITALHEGAGGDLWLGGHGAVLRVNRRGQVQQDLRHPGGTTYQLRSTTDGSLWLCTDDGLYRVAPNGTAPQRVVRADGSALEGVVFVTALAPDGSLWVGSVNGLFRIEPGQTVLQPVLAESADTALGSQVIAGLLFDRQQQLWVDTGAAGLHRMQAWDGRRARFDRISLRHGMQSRPFGANLQADAQGRIWSHIHVYDPRDDTLLTLTAADGVSFGTGWFLAQAQAPDGRLFFGGSRGLLVVQPERFLAPQHTAPLRLTDLRIDGQRQPLTQPAAALELASEQRSLAVQFAVLDYADPGRFRYAYRLEGVDTDWLDSDADLRTAAYSQLQPGRYTLRVRAGTRNGAWRSDELTLDVQVHPAWWQRPASKALAVLLGLMLLWALLQWRTRRLRGQRRALETAVAARTAELEATRAELEERVQARTRELAAASAAAEAANRAKTAFLQSVSHEMRTPLNAILGLTYLAQADVAPGPQQRRLGQVTTAAQQLLKLINEVLERARREAGGGAVLAAETHPPPAVPPDAPLPQFKGERVLLAEDEAVNQLVAVGILERAGLVVDVAENGVQALRLATANPYALVLMDLQMPELDGLAATRALRATDAGQGLPIVALSAFAFDEDRQRCLDAGMNDHVSKPVNPAELLHTVRRWMRVPPA